jgi:hypothetical protein
MPKTEFKTSIPLKSSCVHVRRAMLITRQHSDNYATTLAYSHNNLSVRFFKTSHILQMAQPRNLKEAAPVDG